MRRLSRILLTTALMVGPLVLLAGESSAAAPTPTITVTPDSVSDGQQYAVTGTGCLPSVGEPTPPVVYVTIDQGFHPVYPDDRPTEIAVKPKADGTWSVTSTAVYGLPAYGYHNLDNLGSVDAVCDRYTSSFSYPQTDFEVSPVSATIDFPDSGNQEAVTLTVGKSTPVTGSRFLPGEAVVLMWGTDFCGPDINGGSDQRWVDQADVVASFTADGSGDINGRFTLSADALAQADPVQLCLIGVTSFRVAFAFPTIAAAPTSTTSTSPGTTSSTTAVSTEVTTSQVTSIAPSTTTATAVAALANTGVPSKGMLELGLMLALGGGGLTLLGRRTRGKH